MEKAAVVAADLDPVVAQEADQVLDQALGLLVEGRALQFPPQDRGVGLREVGSKVAQVQAPGARVKVQAAAGLGAQQEAETAQLLQPLGNKPNPRMEKKALATSTALPAGRASRSPRTRRMLVSAKRLSRT